ncbi:MAG: UvrD-helicase domain-containing protein [Anaeroplasmataceae bacterium]|nr:UvrD-helicase domain-containing protein [Anaeroplasmataceae bacterium]
MLTKEQIHALQTTSNYTLLIAGPGTGKTTVLTERIIYLIEHQNIPEERIHAFTFTNKATREMENRISKRINRTHSIGISNFHSFTFLYLKQFLSSSITVVTDIEKKKILENLILERNFVDLSIKDVCKEISRIKNNLIIEEPSLFKRLKIVQLYFAYEEYLKENSKVDFNGMNCLFLELLKKILILKKSSRDPMIIYL